MVSQTPIAPSPWSFRLGGVRKSLADMDVSAPPSRPRPMRGSLQVPTFSTTKSPELDNVSHRAYRSSTTALLLPSLFSFPYVVRFHQPARDKPVLRHWLDSYYGSARHHFSYSLSNRYPTAGIHSLRPPVHTHQRTLECYATLRTSDTCRRLDIRSYIFTPIAILAVFAVVRFDRLSSCNITHLSLMMV